MVSAAEKDRRFPGSVLHRAVNASEPGKTAKQRRIKRCSVSDDKSDYPEGPRMSSSGLPSTRIMSARIPGAIEPSSPSSPRHPGGHERRRTKCLERSEPRANVELELEEYALEQPHHPSDGVRGPAR